jgi:hypothetical protein
MWQRCLVKTATILRKHCAKAVQPLALGGWTAGNYFLEAARSIAEKSVGTLVTGAAAILFKQNISDAKHARPSTPVQQRIRH